MLALRSIIFKDLFVLPEGLTRIGRRKNCEIVIASDSVSKLHLEVLVQGGHTQIRDPGSHNRTYLNGQLLMPGAWHTINGGDRIEICDIVLQVVDLQTDSSSSGSISIADTGDATQLHKSHHQPLSLSKLSQTPHLANQQLRSLVQLTQSLRNALDLDQVFKDAADILLKIFSTADRVAILINQGEQSQPKFWRTRNTDPNSDIRISRTLISHVTSNCTAVLTADAQYDFSQIDSVHLLSIRSIMCSPLLSTDGVATGAVYLDSQQGSQFSKADLDILAAVSTQLSMAINYVRLHEAAMKYALVSRDVESARAIQLKVLPEASPQIPGFEVAGFYRAARHIGGDYYDYIPLSDGRWAIVLGDVVGKGVPAALTMVRLATETRFALEVSTNPTAVLTRLNQRLPNNFITLIVTIVDPASGLVCIGNAGNELPLLRRADGSTDFIGNECTSCPIGVDENETYSQITFPLSAGESLSIYSDGVCDAESAQLLRFGRERLKVLVAENQSSAQSSVERIVNEVDAFMGTHPQFDDICFVQIRRMP
jgi:phosphoserine phosphatase RsbU/P